MLPAPECKRLLAVAAKGGGVGRLGIATDQAPVVIPVNFALNGRAKSGSGSGAGFLARAAAGHLVAFEVDHVDFGLRNEAWSVLVRGLATLIESPDDARARGGGAPPRRRAGGQVEMAIRPDILTGRPFQRRTPR